MIPVTVAAPGIVVASQLSDLFARYNPAVWPAPVIAYALVVVTLALLVLRPGVTASRVTTGLLAALWLWLGVVFHGMYATDVDPALGTIYAGLFIVQAGLFLRAGIGRDELTFTSGHGVAGAVGWLSLAYALVAYPLTGIALGHAYPEAPLFGVAPCPTTIATFGLLLLAGAPLPRHLLAVPLLWAVLGPLGAVPQGMLEDVGLFVIGVAATVIVLIRDRRVHPRRGMRRRPVGISRARSARGDGAWLPDGP